MQLDSESWSCRQCGGGFIGGKPDDLICEPCASGSDPAAALDNMIRRAAYANPGHIHSEEVPGDDH